MADGTEATCQSCGAPRGLGDVFCIRCGAQLSADAHRGPIDSGPASARRRSGRIRGGTIVAASVLVAALGALVWVVGGGREEEPPAAPCGPVRSRPDFGVAHLEPGEEYVPPERPAASGTHHAVPLPPDPRVYTRPIDEARAVHNLEHAYVLVYYRSNGSEALDPETVLSLASLAERESKVIVAPYPALPDGTTLALVAWRQVEECGAEVSMEEAVDAARGFIARFRGTANAPEPLGA